MTQLLGKYRGVVTDIDDPLRILRIKASVPEVFGTDESGWALPCLPFGGTAAGLFALPAVGAGVWIEFEHGDPDFPIWTGSWWSSAAEVPPDWAAAAYSRLMLVTPAGHTLTIDDTPDLGGITVKTADGAEVRMGPTGVTISNCQVASIRLTGPQVSIDEGARDVT